MEILTNQKTKDKIAMLSTHLSIIIVNVNEVNSLIQQKINNIKEEISKYQEDNKILKTKLFYFVI